MKGAAAHMGIFLNPDTPSEAYKSIALYSACLYDRNSTHCQIF